MEKKKSRSSVFSERYAGSWLGACEKCGESVYRDELNTKRAFGGVSYYSHKTCPDARSTERTTS